MLITINIEAETIQDFHTHLSVIQTSIRKIAKSKGLDPNSDEFAAEDGAKMDDNNCYGTHEVTIVPESEATTEDINDSVHVMD